MLGASLAHLVPTVIALALYFCAADGVLVTQILYYNHINSRERGIQPSTQVNTEDRPDQPLLSRTPSHIGLAGSRRRSSVSQKRQGAATLLPIPEGGGYPRPWLKISLSVFAVCALGAVGWLVAFLAGIWTPSIENPQNPTHDSLPAQVLGYLSAVLFPLFMVPLTVISADMYSYCTSGRVLYQI